MGDVESMEGAAAADIYNINEVTILDPIVVRILETDSRGCWVRLRGDTLPML
jgi:hypothetical protein